ncbi:hypothetical protein [Candidatus Reidiella endopervernicosa]|nr:hypothetical protein [Candidatus Reidiella endopervernicosa]QKQ27902.1 hypothetical protein HUE57_17665 [Candidatus Reidiella endopervernicosa]
MRTRRFTLKAYTAAFATLLIGAVISIRLGDWSWFSRSGSLVVVNGIILTSHQIIEHMHALTRNHQHGMQVRHDWASEEKHNLINGDNEKRWRIEKYGLYMLIIGTLVWGFGDLVNTL